MRNSLLASGNIQNALGMSRFANLGSVCGGGVLATS